MKKIAITINTVSLERTWNNGLYQNLHALASLLIKTGRYKVTLLVSSFDRVAERYSLRNPDIGVVSYTAAKEGEAKFDAILEVGYAMPADGIRAIRKHNKEVKIVKLSYGNTYIAEQEHLVRPLDDYEPAPYDSPRDALWSSPHFDYSRDWEALVYQAPIARQSPYIWTPTAIEISMHKAGLTLADLNIEKSNVAVLEPNLNILKTSAIPAAIAEALHRKSPGLLKSVKCFNGYKLIKNKAAMALFGHMTAVRDRILTFEKRQTFVNIFSKYAGVLLSHHHYNGLNYVYLEALHLGIPIVHNSEYFKDAGYYYEELDIHTGADRLEEAILQEEIGYNEAAKEYLFEYSPENPKNIQGYIDLIEELF